MTIWNKRPVSEVKISGGHKASMNNNLFIELWRMAILWHGGGMMQRQGEGKNEGSRKSQNSGSICHLWAYAMKCFSYLQGFSEERGGHEDCSHQTSQWREERPTNGVWMQLLKREKVFVKTWQQKLGASVIWVLRTQNLALDWTIGKLFCCH